MKLDSIPKRSKAVAWRTIEGETLLVPLRAKGKQERINIFNDTATYIWNQINGRRSVAQIIAKIVAEYNGDAKKIEKQVKGLLNELHDKKILEVQ
jgi:hypothetical protein